MKDFLLTLLHLAVMTAKLCGPGGVRAVIAENLLLKQQLIVLRRARQRAPNLTVRDRLLSGFGSLFLSVSQTFGVDIDKNVVHRVLSKHYRPAPGGTGPSWLSFLGHTTDSLWSVDLFRCESIVLRSYWVLVVMDQFTRRIIGLGVHRGAVDGPSLCRMFNAAIHGRGAPRHLSTDHDPLFEAHGSCQ
jgi:transposase InsO family protein